MSRKDIHKYFERRASEWNVLGFLNTCDAEPFERKIDCYLSSLDMIADDEKDCRSKDKADFIWINVSAVYGRSIDWKTALWKCTT